MKLIRELVEDINIDIITEKESNKRNYYLEGITLQGEIKNKNGRIYPDRILSEAVNSHVVSYLNSGRALGELNHPMDNVQEINYKEASHKFIAVEKQGNNFWTRAKVMDTPNGKIVKNLIDEGIKPGISSRALGEVKESGGAKVVQSLYIVSLGDIVSNPSAPDAFVSGILEGREWVFENGIIVEKETEVEEKIDTWQDALKKASKKDINDVAVRVFQDYLNTLLKK